MTKPAPFTDIHNHLLFDVDDGCTSVEETLAYLDVFYRSGCRGLAFTPHLDFTDSAPIRPEDALRLHQLRFAEVRIASAGLFPDLGLRLGQEIQCGLPAHVERAIRHPELGVGTARTLLIEFGFTEEADRLGVARAAGRSGRTVLIAHPERYPFGSAEEGFEEAVSWRNAGCLLQVNAGSLTGRYGRLAREIGEMLLRRDLVSVLASDCHGNARPDLPNDALPALAALGLTADQVTQMRATTPENLLY
jgi:protein-tyrosine phosphatase